MVRPGNKRLLKARLTKEGAGVNKDGLYFKIGRPVSLKHVFNKNCSSYCNVNNIVGKRNITEQLQFQDNGLELTIQQAQQRVAQNKTRGMLSKFDLFKTSNKRIVNESMKPLPNLKLREAPTTTRSDELAGIFYAMDKKYKLSEGDEEINLSKKSANLVQKN